LNTGFDGFELPRVADWQKFERLCRDLWAELWGDPNTQLNGRSGQAQAGVDVFGRRNATNKYSGVQCKRRDNVADDAEITEEELRGEVDKAKSFVPALSGEFVLAFTGKRDAKIQAVARTITQAHAALGLFEVVVCSWDDIQERLGEHPEVVAKHYPGLVATFQALIRTLPEPTVPLSEGSSTAEVVRARSVVIEPNQIQADAEYSAEIQMIRAALKEGHPRVALQQGATLRTRIWELAGPVPRARLLVLLAHAHLELGEGEQASQLLIEAAGQAPNDAYVQAQVALGHSLAGNEDAARTWATKALAQNPTDMVAIQVAALHDDRNDEEVLATYEKEVGKRAELYAVLGHKAARRKESAKARAWFDQAISLDPKDANVLASAADAIIGSVNSELTSRFDGSLAARPDLLRAVKFLEEAIASLSDESMRKARASWFVALVLAKRLLMAKDTVETAEAALLACGRPDELVRLRAAIASDAGDHAKVVELVEPLSLPREFDDVGLLAAAYGNLGQLERSTSLWLELLSRDDIPDHIRHEARRSHAFSLLLADKKAEAKSIVAQHLAATPRSLSPLLVAVAVAERLAETGERDRFLEEAVSAATTGSTYLQLQLGDALMRAQRWADASEVYARVVTEGDDNFYARRYQQALFKAGRYDTLLKSCQSVESKHGLTRYVAEMRSSVYELLGDLARAADACRAFLAIEPTHPVLGLRLALVLQRGGDPAGSEAALRQIDSNAMPDVDSSAILAQMLVRVGRSTEALEVAYRMRKRHSGEVEAHLRYVSIYMLAKGSTEADSDSPVRLDSAVQLTGTGAPGWILVSSASDADVNQKEYAPQHPLSTALIGKRAGDTIPVLTASQPWTITSVGTKYGFAFGRTVELFPAHFPTEAGIEQHEFGSGGTEQFARQLKDRLKRDEPRREAMLNEYAAGRLGIGSVATILGLTTWQAMGTLLDSPRGLICSTNSREERQNGLGLLRDSQAALVLDITAVISLDEAGLLRTGSVSRRPLVVAQRTLDEVASEHFRWQTTPDEGSMSIGVDGDRLIKYETGPDEVRRRREYFQGLLEWLRATAKVEAVAPSVAERHTLHDDIGEFLGEAFWDSIRIAAAPGMVLVSDDLCIRGLAQNELGVRGVCTGILLAAEVEAGHLERSVFSEAIARMTVAGYRTLSTDSLVLEAAARVDQWRLGPWLSKVLSTLRGPDTNTQSAILVAAEFVRAIWLNVVLSAQRAALLIAVLDALAVGRDRDGVAAALRARLQTMFRLLPIAADEARRITLGWEKMRGVELIGR
jgi:tetratricopeptide (TPR) repeat protein